MVLVSVRFSSGTPFTILMLPSALTKRSVTGCTVAPARAVCSSAEMKMCSISVAPMPSISSMPVASRHSVRVEAGNASPAETHLRSRVARSSSPRAARLR